MNKAAGEYSPRMEWLAERYRLITYSKQVERAMAKEGFQGEISFMGRQAIFFPENEELRTIIVDGPSEMHSLIKMIHKLLNHTLDEYREFSHKEN